MGATPIQNVGAYGQDVAETIVAVEVFDRPTRARLTLDNEACRFGYRMSRFKAEDAGSFIVLGVTYRLRPGGPPAVKYAELARYFSERGVAEPTLAQARAAVLEVRKKKSMVLDPGRSQRAQRGVVLHEPDRGRGGLRGAVRPAIAEGVAPGMADIPHYPAGPGRLKMSAAWLIERAGFSRGYTRGPVGLSERHTLAIVNRGGARAADVVALAREIRDGVRARFGLVAPPRAGVRRRQPGLRRGSP